MTKNNPSGAQKVSGKTPDKWADLKHRVISVLDTQPTGGEPIETAMNKLSKGLHASDEPEAYVPLPDGKRIPVHMQGGGGGGNNIIEKNSVDIDLDAIEFDLDPLEDDDSDPKAFARSRSDLILSVSTDGQVQIQRRGSIGLVFTCQEADIIYEFLTTTEPIWFKRKSA